MSVVGGNDCKSKVSSGTEMSKNLGDKQLTIWRNLESTVLIIHSAKESKRGGVDNVLIFLDFDLGNRPNQEKANQDLSFLGLCF